MMKRSRIAAVVLAAAMAVAGATALLRAQVPPEINDPDVRRVVDRSGAFLQSVSTGNVSLAYEDLLEGSQLRFRAEAVRELEARTEGIAEKYGDFRATELIDARRVGQDLILLKYLYKCGAFPVVWYFSYYRAPGHAAPGLAERNWVVVSVRFDTDLELLAL